MKLARQIGGGKVLVLAHDAFDEPPRVRDAEEEPQPQVDRKLVFEPHMFESKIHFGAARIEQKGVAFAALVEADQPRENPSMP